jgi:hypothetical protein
MSIVYTSDMLLTSCYQMPSSPPSAPTPLSTSSLGPPSSTSIYTVSNETFEEDFNAYVTIDIV